MTAARIVGSHDPETTMSGRNMDACECKSSVRTTAACARACCPPRSNEHTGAKRCDSGVSASASNRKFVLQRRDGGSDSDGDSGFTRLLQEQHRLIEQQSAHIVQLRRKLVGSHNQLAVAAGAIKIDMYKNDMNLQLAGWIVLFRYRYLMGN